MTGKTVCTRHEVAYENEKGCPWCDGSATVAPIVLTRHPNPTPAPPCHFCPAMATTTVDIGYGKLHVCQPCADLYQRTLAAMHRTK